MFRLQILSTILKGLKNHFPPTALAPIVLKLKNCLSTLDSFFATQYLDMYDTHYMT